MSSLNLKWIIYVFKNTLKTINVQCSVMFSLLRFQMQVDCLIKMASATVETIYFQDEIPVMLNTSLELETYIKGHDV